MPRKRENVETGQRVRAVREGLGLSRAQFAARLGISAVTLKNGELGITKLGGRTLRDVERLSSGGVAELHEELPPYRTNRERPLSRSSVDTDAVIRNTIKALSDGKLEAAAAAMAEALRVTLDEARAIVIRESMRDR